MNDVEVRHCGPGDYAAVVSIYNHYIEHSPATFETAHYTVGARVPWFAQFAEQGPHQLLVAVADRKLCGFCCSTRFKRRPAYDVSVETTAYVAPEATGHGVGFRLYEELFARISGSGLHGAYAGITLPNDASVRLHEKVGFQRVGLFSEVGHKFDQYWSVAWFEKRM